MFTETIWKVEPSNASWIPAILTRCPACKANATQVAPDAKFFHAGKHQRGTVALGMQWATAFKLQHHPTCATISARYQAVDDADQKLNAPKHQIYLLEQAVLQTERELARAYLATAHWTALSQIQQKLDSARAALEQGRTRLAPLIAALERKLTDAQTALENARGESVPEKTLAEFKTAMAKYLPLEDAPEPTPPGMQRVNGHLINVF